MTFIEGPLLPLVALAFPLALAAVGTLATVRPYALRLLPLGPLPALVLALVGSHERETEVPDLLLGVVLGLDDDGALFLGATAFLWLMAGLYGMRYLAGTHRPAVFASFWLLTLAGNLGVFLARDVATFYVAFSTVSLAAWALVVHEATPRALRAGRIYILLAFCGETALLFGLVIAVGAAGGMMVDEVSGALAEDFEYRNAAIALIAFGLAMKAGLVPLHVWLPLAHSVAPTPASAVLSGAIVNAGIFGLLSLLPTGAAPDWAALLLWTGIATAWLGIVLGLTQREPKAVLAYSTVSQMGLVVALVAVGLREVAAADAGHVRSTAAFYAAHHGLAKGALFLSVGVIAAAGGRHLVAVMALAAIVAASVAGFPLTGGSAAKAAIKEPFGETLAAQAIALSAVGTSLLLIHFLARVSAERGSSHERPPAGLLLPWIGTAAAALFVPWVILPGFTDLSRGYLTEPGHLWEAAWPVAVALGLALSAWAVGLRRGLPGLPVGDIVVLAERAAGHLGRWTWRAVDTGVRAARVAATLPRPSLRGLEVWGLKLERSLLSWSVTGLLLGLLSLLI